VPFLSPGGTSFCSFHTFLPSPELSDPALSAPTSFVFQLEDVILLFFSAVLPEVALSQTSLQDFLEFIRLCSRPRWPVFFPFLDFTFFRALVDDLLPGFNPRCLFSTHCCRAFPYGSVIFCFGFHSKGSNPRANGTNRPNSFLSLQPNVMLALSYVFCLIAVLLRRGSQDHF